MPTTAQAIIEASFGDIGVLGVGRSLSPEEGQDGLRRLNNLVSGLQLQSGTVSAIVRTIFPLVDNQQTYTIGLGGDFNVPRPTAEGVTGAGLLMQGLAAAVSVTSMARTDYSVLVTQTAHGLAVGDEVLIQGANEIDYNGLQTVQTVPTANTYTFTVNGLPETPATGTLTAATLTGQPVEIPRPVITTQAYQAQQLKNLPNSLFTNVYYNPTFPFGTIVLWPRPDTTVNQLVLYLETTFTEFADLDTEYDWPALPGYAEMLQYQLDLRLVIPYARSGAQITPDIKEMAARTLMLVKRGNNQLVDLPTDASLLAHDRRSGYNINTDTGG